MKRFLVSGCALYAAAGAVACLFAVLGEVLTGGVRLDARPAPELMDPTGAVLMVGWLISVAVVAITHIRSEMETV